MRRKTLNELALVNINISVSRWKEDGEIERERSAVIIAGTFLN